MNRQHDRTLRLVVANLYGRKRAARDLFARLTAELGQQHPGVDSARTAEIDAHNALYAVVETIRLADGPNGLRIGAHALLKLRASAARARQPRRAA